MLPFALLIAAHAADEACLACCRVGGLPTCETTLVVYGDGSRIGREAGAWRVSGLWRVGCDGRGVFDASAGALLDHPPLGGELVMDVVNPLQVHCFQQACGLPPGTCVSPPDEDGRFFLLDCGTGLPADASALGRAPSADKYPSSRVVVVDGRPLVVAPGTTGGTAASAASAPAVPAVASAPAPMASAPAPMTGAPSPIASAPTTSWSAPVATAPTTTWSAPVPAATPAPTVAPPPSVPVAAASTTGAPLDAFATFATSLPKDPPETCTPPAEALRGEARKRVDAGDEKRIRKDAAGALQEYRAALTMDACNAYGWLGIGEIASAAARPDLAVRALRNTTRILPGHYGAWTMLGKAYEGLHQAKLAAEAYSKALELRPGLPEALDGWRRTASP